jgi:hypothetical protein
MLSFLEINPLVEITQGPLAATRQGGLGGDIKINPGRKEEE